MHVQTYDPHTGNVISDASTLDFGSVKKGYHSYNPVVFRILLDQGESGNLKLFLEDDGGGGQYGCYVSPNFIPSVKSGGQLLRNHLVETPDASATSPHGVSVPVSDGTSHYLWLDVYVPPDLNRTLTPVFRLIVF